MKSVVTVGPALFRDASIDRSAGIALVFGKAPVADITQADHKGYCEDHRRDGQQYKSCQRKAQNAKDDCHRSLLRDPESMPAETGIP